MRTLKFLLVKEFKQIFRNKALLPLIFVMPIIQLLVLPLTADYEVKNINIAVVDHDHSSYARELVEDITASGYFRLVEYGNSFATAFERIESDVADLILEIPANFERDLLREGRQEVFVAVNAINGVKASLGGSYLTRILREFNRGLATRFSSPEEVPSRIELTFSNWYNADLNYKVFMVPGILVVLVTMVASYLCGLNIVKEKEIGTIEQINVSPIKKHHYILGKLIPFWFIGIFIFSLGFFAVSWMFYGIAPVGSILLLYIYLSLFLVALLGFGLLLSTYAETQQQVMSVAFFFMMIFILMSGLFTSIDSMPSWAKMIAAINPVTYFIEVMRMVVLKGSGFGDIKVHFLAMVAFAGVFNSWAILNYRKTI